MVLQRQCNGLERGRKPGMGRYLMRSTLPVFINVYIIFYRILLPRNGMEQLNDDN